MNDRAKQFDKDGSLFSPIIAINFAFLEMKHEETCWLFIRYNVQQGQDCAKQFDKDGRPLFSPMIAINFAFLEMNVALLLR